LDYHSIVRLDGYEGGKRSDWPTPWSLFAQLNDVFDFRLDVCADASNRKCERYFTKDDDALTQQWDDNWFCNPPYHDSEQPCKPKCAKKTCAKRGWHREVYLPGVHDWVEYGIQQAWEHRTVGVYLLASRTSTKWFHSLVQEARCFVNFNFKVKFEGAKNPAFFPSVLCVLDPRKSIDILRLRQFGSVHKTL
jgi:site-specific DNA-methyltransferase (adenine-specific)